MTSQQFDLQIQRLQKKWGKRSFDESAAEMIWGFVKEIPYEEMIRAVDHQLGSARKCPVPYDFHEVAKIWRRNNQPKQTSADEIKCQTCQDTGSISAWRRGVKYKHSTTYAFRCPKNCEKANKISSQIQQWTSNFESDFIPCLNPLKSPHEVWKERHVELYGFPESDRLPKKHKPIELLDNLITAAVDKMNAPTPELNDDDVLPF